MATVPVALWIAGGAIFLAAGAITAVLWRRSRELAVVRRELARRISELFSLQELTFLLSESLQPERIVQQVAKYAVRFLDADGAMVGLGQPGDETIQIAAAEGTFTYLAGAEVKRAESGLLAAAIAQGHVERVEAAGESLVELLPGLEVRRAAVAPLRAHGATLGALAVANRREPFTEADLRLLTSVAAHTAAVLANGRLFQMIRSGKDEWEGTFDALADGIAVVDGAGMVRRANRAFATLVGTPITEIGGLGFVESLFGTSPEVQSLLDSARRAEQPAGVTLRSERLRRVLRLHAAPIMHSDADRPLVALVEDVTEQKALEAQVIQHEKMAAVGQLVSGVAHELNNPLTSIAGLSELLLEQAGTPARSRDHLRVIHEQAERAGKIVRNLLTFARQGPAELASVDLNDVAQRTVLLMGYEVRLREVDLHTELAAELPPVRGDRYQLQQVVVNLLTNAVQAVGVNPPGRPRRVILRTRQREQQVVLEVEDTGPGVPAESVSQVFAPFFTTKEPGQGTGLGLSLSYNIVERHQGTLTVAHAASGGAVFTMSLPAGRASRIATPPPRAAVPPPGNRGVSRAVLLVDGDPAVRRMLTVLFSSDGHRVEAARDAAHGIELLGQKQFDLVIADPRAGVSAGEAFADVLISRWPAIRDRTILATADVRPETEEWLKKLGCRYFRKPFNARELRAVAREVFGQ
jgi:two-component system NtrC family sensor kinase